MTRLAGCLGTLVVFALLNGILWAGQELYHRGDVQRVEAIEVNLNQLDRQIQQDEEWLAANLAYYERNGPASVYNIRVDGLNDQVNRYNLMVDEYNTLARKAYRRLYLIPIPGGRPYPDRAHHGDGPPSSNQRLEPPS